MEDFCLNNSVLLKAFKNSLVYSLSFQTRSVIQHILRSSILLHILFAVILLEDSIMMTPFTLKRADQSLLVWLESLHMSAPHSGHELYSPEGSWAESDVYRTIFR